MEELLNCLLIFRHLPKASKIKLSDIYHPDKIEVIASGFDEYLQILIENGCDFLDEV